MKLSLLAVLMGSGFCVPQIYGLWKPGAFREVARKFPRSENWGYALMLLGTGWFLWNLHNENISDFAPYKPAMMLGFAAIGIGTCVFVRDFLAVRGFAVVMLLLAKVMVDTARWVDSEWRLVIVVWAYLLIIGGMWFTVAPWRLRDLVEWMTRSDRRVRLGSAVRLAFGLLVIVLGLTVY